MTLDLKNVLYEQDGDVVTVTINRPQHLNAVSRRVYFELDEAFRHAEEDPSVKVIVVTGAGDHFGAGHDLGTEEMRSELDEFPRDMSPEGRIRTMDRGVYFRLHDRWRNLAKPTIAMVQGYCIMGSWMVASCCDLIVASEDAKFTDRSVRWGVVSHEYVTQFFDLGIKKAKEILWTGDFLTAEEAETLLQAAEQADDQSVQLLGFTRAIKDNFSYEERVGLIEMLWEVVYADGKVDEFESQLMRRIGGLIYVTDRDRGIARKQVLQRLEIDKGS